MYAIGVNPWVWTSPVDDAALAELVPRIAGFGFDAVELPIEQPGDWDPVRTRDLLAAYGLAAAGVCAVTPPGRDLVAAAPAVVEATVAYLRSCVDSAAVLGAPCVGGPVYASVGRTWRMSPAARAACYADFRRALAPVVHRRERDHRHRRVDLASARPVPGSARPGRPDLSPGAPRLTAGDGPVWPLGLPQCHGSILAKTSFV
ncbi:TIM barrel protein [Micromonospora endolithica]|uniref:TIM barrel protein n=1 Tax=Micromonospora endolithica TaxID=230091 RepID=UPI0011AC28F7|nr:TIM barrel protein [Micromonospora endolithica]TWJ22996.1 xylose isomerase-like TIM barrel protein [Micromonospora endolithica]